MNGLEISRAFYEEYGKSMLEEQFPELLPLIAVGFVGSGSEKFGFDDEFSRDHDFEAGFAIFLPDEDLVDSRTEFRLERAYAKLPKEFMGVRRPLLSPVGGNRCGPIRTSDFYLQKTGFKNGDPDLKAWLTIPDHALAEAVNGEVFYDGYGEFSKIRENLSRMPDDVFRKRLAGNLLVMAQSGQYNFTRCLSHGEYEAAALSCREFVWAAIRAIFLLNGKYAPYYKWCFRALRNLGENELADLLSEILLTDFHDGEKLAAKYDAIESAASLLITKLQDRELTKAVCGDLEKHAYSVNDSIKDAEIRNLHILVSI